MSSRNLAEKDRIPCETLVCPRQSCEAQPCGLKGQPQRPEKQKKKKKKSMFFSWLEESNDSTFLKGRTKTCPGR